MSTIYHNPRCSTSRTVLQAMRDSGHEPEIIEYLKTPLSSSQLLQLIQAAGLSVREAVRTKEALYTELGLDTPGVTDGQLLAAMEANPVLLNRPFVQTAKGTRLCRPADTVQEIL